MSSSPSPSPIPPKPSPFTISTTPPPPLPSNEENEIDTSDIWASDSPPSLPQANPSPNTNTNTNTTTQEPLLSDIPSLRRQHITAGYREGLAIGKARVIQAAFDQGYPLGVALALRVGTVLGVLEGCVAALSVSPGGGDGPGKSGGEQNQRLKVVKDLLARARRELDVVKMLEGMEEDVLVEAGDVSGLKGLEEVVRRWEGVVLCGFEEQVAVEGNGVRSVNITQRVKEEREGSIGL